MKPKKGVQDSLEGDELDDEHFNILCRTKIDENSIEIETRFKYALDISNIESTEIARMLELPEKQNYDESFEIQIA